MFIINLSPQVNSAVFNLSKNGDVLTLNEEVYDFTALVEGATLPKEAINSDWIISDVSRNNGNIELSLLFPISSTASEAARFPVPLEVSVDGVVTLPE